MLTIEGGAVRLCDGISRRRFLVARRLDKLSLPTAGPRRDLRAVELLELIGSAEARRVLKTVAGGMPGARLTREARSALQRLAQQVATH
jgi:hypothetical protein